MLLEIRFHGRGGQGTVLASETLALAFFKNNFYVQAFPQFGVERRGAPVTAYLRVGKKDELFVRSFIYEPDYVIILDPTLLSGIPVLSGLKKGGWVLINSPKPPHELENSLGDFKVATVDANSIAVKYKLGKPTQPIVNTAILGAFPRICPAVSIEHVLESIKDRVKIATESNINAAKEAFEKVLIFEEVKP